MGFLADSCAQSSGKDNGFHRFNLKGSDSNVDRNRAGDSSS
jgi:hypothetical protein